MPPAYYPAFLNIAGRAAVVIGGGEVAARKVDGLLKAGAAVTVVSPQLTPGLQSLASAGSLRWARREYRAGDLEGAWIAIAATDEPAVNRAVFQEGQQRHVL